MAAIPLERDGVVHILDGCCPSYRYAVLAPRMSRDVSVPDFTPPVVITLVNCRVTLEASVTNVLGFNVCGAEPLRSEIVTARVRAEAFGFDRHAHRLLRTSSPLNGPPRSACGSLPSGEAGIEPTSLKDRPDIFRAQSMLSLLLGSCTHTDMVQTNSIVEIIPPSHHDNNWAASHRNETRIRADPSITDQAARAKSVRVFSALIDSQRSLTS